MSRLCLAATSLIRAAGPTRIALMILASADSIAPRSELSSQGCTTMVETVDTLFAAAIRRSYFEPGWVALALAAAVVLLIILLRISAPWPMTLSLWDRKGPYCPHLQARTGRRPASGALPLRRRFRRLQPESPRWPRRPCGVRPCCQAGALEWRPVQPPDRAAA